MVYWITGRKNSGKTTLAYRMAKQTNAIVLDGDEFREFFPTGYTKLDRYKNILRIAYTARILENQGKTVIIACVSPFRTDRVAAQSVLKECIEICMPFGELWEGTEFEEPDYA